MTTRFDFFSAFIGVIFGITSFSFFLQWRRKQQSVLPHEHLHWNPLIERRGLGDLLTRLNHIAITVSDVGKSLSFYVDILGLQQIRRPSFDRHGAWLTMGNVELHLIKGIPTLPSVDNLQVSHLALETPNINQVLTKLHELNIDVRQNLSVTSAHKMIEKHKPLITQYFFNDPDGYYIELCNCDVLTEFSLYSNLMLNSFNYHEGIHNKKIFFVIQAVSHWKRLIRRYSSDEFDQILKLIPRANQIDENKFENLIKRRSIYGDITQGFTDEDIREALLQSNNFVPLTIKLLARQRGERIFFRPPSFIEHGELVDPEPFTMNLQEYN
ncbi:hypothetical protein I4U23_010588 [Adineta vaga]|nr:hypothetical protein I4U23_010588 [Adineta vaga]